ncbi:unnamed protein product, partial [marine sediment metagenome]
MALPESIETSVSLNDAFGGGPFTAYCTQEYVEVDYTPAVLAAPNAATGISSTSAILNGTIED